MVQLLNKVKTVETKERKTTMGKTNKNPYKDGTKYAQAFDLLRKAGAKGVTRNDLLEAGVAPADATVILSPRAEDDVRSGCDCRGNSSAQGHKYFVLRKRVSGEKQRHILRWRKTELDKKLRPDAVAKAVPQKKARKSKARKAKKTTATA